MVDGPEGIILEYFNTDGITVSSLANLLFHSKAVDLIDLTSPSEDGIVLSNERIIVDETAVLQTKDSAGPLRAKVPSDQQLRCHCV